MRLFLSFWLLAAASALVDDECPGLCDFGYKKNELGVSICECIPDDEESIVGDMIYTPELKARSRGRGVINNDNMRWTAYRDSNGNYLIPFVYGNVLQQSRKAFEDARWSYNADRKKYFDDSVAYYCYMSSCNYRKLWEKYTCVRFVPRTNQKHYIKVISNKGCLSYVGYYRWANQELDLASGCGSTGTAFHEMMHAAGFFHEQSRPDRDSFITINWDNVQEDLKFAFRIEKIDSLGSPYDIKSVMQYYGYAFSNNGKATIIDKNTSRPVPWNHYVANSDYWQINKFYNC